MKPFLGKKILIVDDEDLIREILVEEFSSLGAEVLEAQNIAVAFDHVCKTKFDAIISDVKMPGGDGMEFFKKVNSHLDLRPKLFLCSGFGSIDTDIAKSLGVIEMFAKPFDLDLIVNTLAKSLS